MFTLSWNSTKTAGFKKNRKKRSDNTLLHAADPHLVNTSKIKNSTAAFKPDLRVPSLESVCYTSLHLPSLLPHSFSTYLQMPVLTPYAHWSHTRLKVHTHFTKTSKQGREQHMTIKSTFRLYASPRGCIFKPFLRNINTKSTHFCLSCPPLLTHAHTFYKPPLFPYSTSTTRIIVLKCWANSQRD